MIYREIDLSKGRKSDHPDVTTDRLYLVKVAGEWHFGRFSRQHYGLNFTNWGRSGLQFDTPGYNSSEWERIVEIDPEAQAGESREAPEGFAVVPVKPPRGLLVSMALRQNHAFMLDRDPADPLSAGVDPSHREATLSSMAQLYEEVVGEGFYAPDKEARYAGLAAPARFEVKPLEWVKAAGPYPYKCGFFTEYEAQTEICRYMIRHSEHNPDAREGYLTKPYAPYFRAVGVDTVRYDTLEAAQAAVWTEHRRRVGALLCGDAQLSQDGRSDQAAQDRISDLELALARSLEALQPFAEFADDMDADGRDLRDEEGIYAFVAGDFRKARAARNGYPSKGAASDQKGDSHE